LSKLRLEYFFKNDRIDSITIFKFIISDHTIISIQYDQSTFL